MNRICTGQWKPEYSINLIGYMAWDLTAPYGIETILHRIRKKVDSDKFIELLPDIAYQSFKETVAGLNKTLGSHPGKWRWGSIHQLKLAHPLGRVKMIDKIFGFNYGPKEVSGSFHTVCPYPAMSFQAQNSILGGREIVVVIQENNGY